MAPRYTVVFGLKDAADRYTPLGEFYLRGVELESAKEMFKHLPDPGGDGDYVFRLYERYYDKHTQVDMNYKKSEFTRETNQAGFHHIMDSLVKLQEQIEENS